MCSGKRHRSKTRYCRARILYISAFARRRATKQSATFTEQESMDHEVEIRVKREAVATAQAILRGEVDLIEGSRQLAALSHALLNEIPPGDELIAFDEVDLETRTIPIGIPREQWDPTVRAEADIIRRRIESLSRGEIEAACRSVISRFGNGTEASPSR
jgi:hypothetical protein